MANLVSILKKAAETGVKGINAGAKALESGGKLASLGVKGARGAGWFLDDKVLKPIVSKLAKLLRNSRDKSEFLKNLAANPAVDDFLKTLKRMNTSKVRKGVVAGGLGIGGLSVADSLLQAPEYEMVPYDTGYDPSMGSLTQEDLTNY